MFGKNSLKLTKNSGGSYHRISAKIISYFVIRNTVLDVFYNCLQNGMFLNNLKTFIVTPVPKILNAKSGKNININFLLLYVKLFKLLVLEQLPFHCERNKINTPHQSSFTARHSCQAVFIKRIYVTSGFMVWKMVKLCWRFFSKLLERV